MPIGRSTQHTSDRMVRRQAVRQQAPAALGPTAATVQPAAGTAASAAALPSSRQRSSSANPFNILRPEAAFHSVFPLFLCCRMLHLKCLHHPPSTLMDVVLRRVLPLQWQRESGSQPAPYGTSSMAMDVFNIRARFDSS